jgi:hypothetical protein
MTKEMSDDDIKFRGVNLTPEQCEQGRWLTMARCSMILTTAKSADERMSCMETILDKFRDVPNQQPNLQDTAAYARYAAKTFLESLIKLDGKQPSASATEHMSSVATENVFNEWIDEWLPRPHATRMMLPRM